MRVGPLHLRASISIRIENKYMNRTIALPDSKSKKALIELDAYYVMISHKELDQLIASLMHVVELDSDKEHREALKGELKSRVRSWLDSEYMQSGYELYAVQPGAEIIDANVAKRVTQT